MVEPPTRHDIEDEILAKSEVLCSHSLFARNIRDAVATLERQAHATGWDGPDSNLRVFRMDFNPDTEAVVTEWCDVFTNMIRFVCEEQDAPVGVAVQVWGKHFERMRREIETGTLPEGLHWPKPELGEDLVPSTLDEPWKFHGFGLRTEAWMIQADPATYRPAAPYSFSTHPDRIELRTITYFGRDGLLWISRRERGRDAKTYACVDKDSYFGGLINGLSMAVASSVSNPPRIHPERPPGNPLIRPR